MNKLLLKKKAIALEKAFVEYSGISHDIKRLSLYEPLLIAIADAKGEVIDGPREVYLGYWLFETDIQSYPEFELVLAKFTLELEGLSNQG